MKYDYKTISYETNNTYTATKKNAPYQFYHIITIKIDEEGNRFFKTLQDDKDIFAQIIEIFEKENNYHVVFKALKGNRLFPERIFLINSFEERLQLAKSYVLEIIRLNLSDMIMYLMQQNNNIYSYEGKVFFSYQMDYKVLNTYKDKMQVINLCANRVKEILFAEKVYNNLLLKAFEKKIEEGLFTDYIQIYREILLFEQYNLKEQTIEPFEHITDVFNNPKFIKIIRRIIFGMAFVALMFIVYQFITQSMDRLNQITKEPYIGVYQIGNVNLNEEKIEAYDIMPNH